MPQDHIADLIDSLCASRFGHPDVIAAELKELTQNVASLDKIIAERLERCERLNRRDEDQPELDDLELHQEWTYQRDLIAVFERRRAADMSRAVALRERLTVGRRGSALP